MGLGGGFIATVYTKETGIVESLIARETAPAAATKEMFVNFGEVTGAISVAIPGELKGYWELHQKYGKLTWAELVQPSIELAQNGFVLTQFVATTVKNYEEMIRHSPEFAGVFINPSTGQLYNGGDIIHRPKLAATLAIIAADGVNALYTAGGKLSEPLITELQGLGGILTIQDLVNYRHRWEQPQTARIFNNKIMYTAPLPATGSVLIFIMNFLNNYLPLEASSTFYHRIIESFKFAYGLRTKLGDGHFVPDALQVNSYNNSIDHFYKTDNPSFRWNQL